MHRILDNFYDNNKAQFSTKLSSLQVADSSMLPQSKQEVLSNSISNAGTIFDLVNDIKNAKNAMDDAAVAYAPVHAEVRSIERSIARDEKEIKQLQRDLRNETSVSKRNKYQSKIVELQADIENSRDKIPADWQKINKNFKKLTAELNSSRTKLRRQSDQTYGVRCLTPSRSVQKVFQSRHWRDQPILTECRNDFCEKFQNSRLQNQLLAKPLHSRRFGV